MPHFRIEYSSNLKSKMDMAQFCKAMHQSIMATGLFELGAVRVRAFAADDYAIADMQAENTFIDMHFRVGQGRSANALKQAGDKIFATANEQLRSLFETPHFALSFEIVEIDAKLSWKNNAIHARLR
jgi:5-carboxymethyl-2-hydroxymuconate isomerase